MKLLRTACFVTALAIAALPALSPVCRAAADSASSNFQVDAAHDGQVKFSTPFAPPLGKRWSIDFGGIVSYPVVNGGRVSVLVGSKSGTTLVTLNAVSGKTIWTQAVGNSYAHLASDGGRLFLVPSVGAVRAYDAATGRLLWSSSTLVFDTPILVTPVAAGGFLYVGIGETVYQLDGATGTIRWKQYTQGGVGVTLGDGKVFMPVTCLVDAVDAATGSSAWRFDGGCEGGGGATGAFYNHRLYAPQVLSFYTGLVLAPSNGKLTGSFPGSIPAFDEVSSYAISEKSLVAGNVRTGDLRWVFRPKGTLWIPPIAVNGNTYTLTIEGTLYVNSGQTGALLQTLEVGIGGATSPSRFPAIADWTGLGAGAGLLFVPSGNIFAAYGPQ